MCPSNTAIIVETGKERTTDHKSFSEALLRWNPATFVQRATRNPGGIR
jgi:hypothetical protein